MNLQQRKVAIETIEEQYSRVKNKLRDCTPKKILLSPKNKARIITEQKSGDTWGLTEEATLDGACPSSLADCFWFKEQIHLDTQYTNEIEAHNARISKSLIDYYRVKNILTVSNDPDTISKALNDAANDWMSKYSI